jgi:23S rRNA (cytidine1920-2'-O)/16S rRNA (cytidine1409-2'-O)-methyltransferase
MRLDLFLADRGEVESRTEAKKFITEGAVKVKGSVITKPAFDISPEETDYSVDKSIKKYVSRGGLKLEAALKSFGVSVKDRLCLDIGASSGGFTDCLLQHGAEHVISVDSGSGQLVESIRRDSRVTSIENFNARYMTASDFEYAPSLAVMDVSFISATYIIPAIYDVLDKNGEFICLIKPQFEVGKSGLSKGGIVKNEKNRVSAVNKVTDFAKSSNFILESVIQSPICGGDGNIEYLAYFRKI